MRVENFVSMAMQAWVNFLSHFMVMNMYLTTLPLEPMNARFLEKEYDFIVGKLF